MANIGNAERCNGLAQLGIDLSGTEKQRHRYACWQRNGVEWRGAATLRTATDWHRAARKRIAAKRRSFEQQSKGTASKSLARTRNAKEQIRWQRNGIAQLAK